MKKNKSNLLKAVVAIAVALAFVMPVAAFANVGTIGVISNGENTGDNDMKNIEEVINSDNSDSSYIKDTELPTSRGTIYVDDDQPPEWYDATHVKTIQEGINNATAGDMVYVYNGTYYEHVTVNKSLDLVGESRDNVIVDGSGTGKVLYIVVSNVNITSFTMTHGQYGVHLDSSSHCTFSNCRVIDNILTSGAWGFYANSANFTSIIGGNYSHNGNTGNDQNGYNIYFTNSHDVTVDGVIVDEPVQGAKAPTCPMLYSWDGSKFTFQGDTSIGGSMGFRSVIHQKSQPFDYTVVQSLEPEDGAYKFVVGEEQKELLYFDSAKLLVIDHEPGVKIFSPTPIYIAEPQIEDPVKIYTVRDPRPPVSAFDENGNDVLDEIKFDDDIYTDVATKFHHDQITVDLGDLSDASQIKLLVKARNIFVDEPPFIYDYSFIEVVDENGEFVRVDKRDDSFPEWTWHNTRTFVLDITDFFLANNYTIRLNTWHLTYIDYLAVDTSPDAEIDITEVIPTSADLFYKGLSTNDDGVYNYYNISGANYSIFTGDFTRYGDVTELVQESDDMYIIANPGDAINITFDAVEEKAGLERTYIFISDAFYKVDWIKHFTGQSFSLVTPLPFHGMLCYPYGDFDVNQMYPYDDEHIAYLNEYNTRYLSYTNPGCEPPSHSAYGVYLDYSDNAIINNVSGRASHAQGGAEYGIYLSRSDYAAITNVSSLTNWEYGIFLYVADNNQICDNILYGNQYGIYLQYSDDNLVTDCDVYDNQYGIYLDGASDNTITNCISHDNNYGIYLYWSDDNIITSNVLANNGIVISGTSLDHWMHTIDTTNTINGRPVYYYKNQVGGTVPAGGGQVILANCSYMTVEDQICNDGTIGIVLGYSSYNDIINCEASNNYGYGIYLYFSSNNNVMSCNVYNNTDSGIQIFKSSYNVINDCDTYNNTLSLYTSGVYIDMCDNITVENTLMRYNGIGLRLTGDSVDCLITGCNVSYSGDYGILLDGAYYNRVENCNVYNTSRRGVAIKGVGEGYNEIVDCNLYNNGWFGFWTQGQGYNSVIGCDVYGNGYDPLDVGQPYPNSLQWGGVGVMIHYKTPGNTVENCTIHDNPEGLFVFCEWSTGQTIRNNEVYNNTPKNTPYRGQGICIWATGDHTIENNSAHDNVCGVYLRANADGTFMGNNTIYDNNYEFGLETYNVLDIDPSNTINGKPMMVYEGENNLIFDATDGFGWLGLYSCTDMTVRDMEIYGVLLVNTPNSTISNVTVRDCGSTGIYVLSSPSTTIIDCEAYENGGYGIGVSSSSFSSIKDCVAHDNAGRAGIMVTSCTETDIVGCESYGQYQSPHAERFGIYTVQHTNSNIKDCIVYNNCLGLALWHSSPNNNITNVQAYNNDVGMFIRHYSGNNNVTNCSIHDNYITGVHVEASQAANNEIYGNNIYNNAVYGIRVLYSYSSGMSFHHNNFVNNTLHASDQSTNQWDDNSSEGNYWDDYTGIDADGDGIGDTPYNISDGNNQDRYPLMEPILAAPELVSPADGSATEDQMPTFDWDDVEPIYEVNYTLRVATDPGFSSIVINQTGLDESEYTPTTNMSYDTYYWKVKAMVGNYTTNWSETWSFTIELDLTPPTTPDLIEPANNSTLVVTPTIFFDWTDAYDFYGIDYYTMQIATDVNFDNIVFDVTPANSDYMLTLTTPDEYYWRVQAVDNNGLLSGWSEIWMFTRLVDTTPPTVELTYPVGGEYLSGDVIILWDATDDITPNVDLPITIEYRCGGPWQILASGEVNDGEYLWDTTGYPDGILYKIRVSTEDYWGNMGFDESYTTFTVDNTAPETTAYLDPATPDGENNWYVSNVRITLVTEHMVRFLNPGTTSKIAGDGYTMYKIDDGDWQEYFVPFTVSEDGEHTVEFYSVDNAGNEEAIGEVTFKIDKTVPTIDLTWDEENSKLVADVDDETSGVAMVEFYVNGELIGEVTSAPYEMEYDASSGDTAYAIVYDTAGNSAESEIVESSQSNLQSQTNPVLTRILQRYTMLKI